MCFASSQGDTARVSVPFKDFVSLEIVPAKKLLSLDSILIGYKEVKLSFSFPTNADQIYRMLVALCNFSLHKLIKGAEASASSFSEASMRIGANGDLSNNTPKAAEFGGKQEGNGRILEENDEELDFANGDILRSSVFALAPDIQVDGYSIFTQDLTGYAQIELPLVYSQTDLWKNIQLVEFRQLFRLPYEARIVEMEPNSSFYDASTDTYHVGTLFLSNQSIHFASFQANKSTPSTLGLVTRLSSIVDAESEMVINVPYSHVVSIKKQAPISLSTFAGNNQKKLSLSGYLVVSTKFSKEISFSFSSLKSRDFISDQILGLMKQVGLNAETDLVIGQRNTTFDFSDQASPVSSLLRTPTSFTISDSNLLVQATKQNNTVKVQVSQGKSIDIYSVPLKFVFYKAVLPDDKLLNLWTDVFRIFGKSISQVIVFSQLRETIVKTCGLPSNYRGDFWLIISGAWYCRPEKEYYNQMLIKYNDKISSFQEEIEKDVKRSLPENKAYQSPAGLAALRRVLLMYSWRNPNIGYAQALNIITAFLLLELREEDAFWMLSTIVEKMLPDHYTKTLVGSVVDQQVFSHLVKHLLPNLHQHMAKHYMDLSTFSVPWFVCLFLNTVSMDLCPVVLDCFFLDGSKFLFWFALAVLKINEKKLLKKRDDEAFINVLKAYFKSLSVVSSAPLCTLSQLQGATDEFVESLTGKCLFQYTLHVAYSFSDQISTDTVETLRIKYRMSVVHQMEDSYRKSQIRNICESVKMSFDEVGIVYDEIRLLEFLRDEVDVEPETELLELALRNGCWGLSVADAPRDWLKRARNVKCIALHEFRAVFSKVSPWRVGNLKLNPRDRTRSVSSVGSVGSRREKPGKLGSVQASDFWQPSFVERLFLFSCFNYHKQMASASSGDQSFFLVDLGSFVSLLDLILKQPLQTRLRYLFDIHDMDSDGFLNKNELKAVMDSLMELFEKLPGKDEEMYLRAISAFLNTALKSGKPAEKGGDLRLGFNEFLLSVLSQSVLLEFFEKNWTISNTNGIVSFSSV